MKRSSIIWAVLLVVVSCKTDSEGFLVEGTLTGDVSNDTQIFLKKTDEQNQLVDLDTTTVVDGNFSFSGMADSPQIHYLFIENVRGNIPLILENGSIEVKAQKDSLAFAKISGTPQNDLFREFLEKSRSLSQRAMSINRDMQKATASGDEATKTALGDEFFELQEEAKNYEQEYVKQHPEALISVYLLDKIMTTKALPEKEVESLFDALNDDIKNSDVGKKVKTVLERSRKTAIGAKAPNFSAPTPTGEQLALNDVLGKVTIVDFWAAWCKPCRVENPNVVKIYEKYHDKGLNILGVSLDRKAADWKKAITDDGLTWNHVSNVQYFDEIAKLYNVKAIPAMFVLNEDGVIVAKNLRGKALEAQIASMLP